MCYIKVREGITEVSLLLEETFAGNGVLWGNPVCTSLPPQMQKKSSDMLGSREKLTVAIGYAPMAQIPVHIGVG